MTKSYDEIVGRNRGVIELVRACLILLVLVAMLLEWSYSGGGPVDPVVLLFGVPASMQCVLAIARYFWIRRVQREGASGVSGTGHSSNLLRWSGKFLAVADPLVVTLAPVGVLNYISYTYDRLPALSHISLGVGVWSVLSVMSWAGYIQESSRGYGYRAHAAAGNPDSSRPLT